MFSPPCEIAPKSDIDRDFLTARIPKNVYGRAYKLILYETLDDLNGLSLEVVQGFQFLLKANLDGYECTGYGRACSAEAFIVSPVQNPSSQE